MDEDEDWAGWDDEDEDYNNAALEDDSWKVRRAAAGILESIILTRVDCFKILYNDIAELLTRRLNERESSVKSCVIKTISSLLKTVEPEADFEEPGFVRTMTQQVTKRSSTSEEMDIRTESQKFIEDKIVPVIEAIAQQYKQKLSPDNKAELTNMIKIMSTIMPSDTCERFDLLFPILESNLNDTQEEMNLRLDTLSIFRILLKSECDAEQFRK